MTDAEGEASLSATLARWSRIGDQLAVRTARRDWTYQELLQEVRRLARSLHAQGLRRGDVVAVQLGTTPAHFAVSHAVKALGCAVAAIPDGVSVSLIASMLRTADATAMVCTAGERAELAGQALAEFDDALPRLLTMGACDVADADLAHAAMAQSAEPIEVALRPDDLAAIRLTGGSTGAPKGVPRQAGSPPPQAALDAWRDTRMLLCTPAAHLAGSIADMVLAAGGAVVLHETFDPAAVIDAIEHDAVTFVWLLPGLLYQLLDYPGLRDADTTGLQSLALGGTPCSPSRAAEAVRRFGSGTIFQGYGTLEATQVSWLSSEDHDRPDLLSTVGRPCPPNQVSIRDETGGEVPDGETGEICVAGPGVMTGYYRDPARTHEAFFTGGWFRTGDLGYLDAEGYLTIVGRRSDVIITRHGHVYPSSIEEVLRRHPEIQDAAVLGRSDGDGEESVCAAVVPIPGGDLDEGEVARFVAAERGSSYAPETVLLLPDGLPTTGAGKPDLAALREAHPHLPSRATGS